MSLLWPMIAHGALTPRRPAVIDDQRRYTYGQLVGGAMFLAEAIERVTPQRHVGVMLPTGGGFVMALLGAWLARRVVVPLNYLLSPQELRYVIHDSDIDTIITAGAMLDFLGHRPGHAPTQEGNAASDTIPPEIRLLKIEGVDFSGLPPLRWPPVVDRDALAVILYTSGTSGRPKGVMLSHGNLRSNVDATIAHAGLTQADTFLGVLPQFHSFGLTALTLLPLRMGAQVVYSARFIPKRVVGLIRKHRPEVFLAVPSMYGALLSLKHAGPEDFASIRLAISGGEPLPQATFEACQDRFGLRLQEGYGLTETAPITNWSMPRRWKRGSVGPALPGVTQLIVDQNDQPLGSGQDGEVLIAGPNVMQGYYKLRDQTRAVITYRQDRHADDNGIEGQPKRFFRTGDIGRFDEDGLLYITGRKKEMLIIGGENVFPREIEEVLNQHQSVQDSAVIGKPDGVRGELPIAYVELRQGHTFDETALRSWCRDRVAGYKVPREIRQIATMPRNPTGKIVRRNLPRDW